MKTRLSLPILLFFAIFVSTSIQQVQRPNCQPISTTKTYGNTLFVFLVESSGSLNALTIRYIMKQLACSIPKANNIQTFILDYTDENATIQTSFYDSEAMIGKIPTSISGAASPPATKCKRMKTVREKFSQLSGVQSKKVKYIALYVAGVCPQPPGVTHWVQIDIKNGEKLDRWFLLEDRHGALFNLDEDNSPQFLIDESNEIIGKALGEDRMVPTAESAKCSTEEKEEKDGCLRNCNEFMDFWRNPWTPWALVPMSTILVFVGIVIGIKLVKQPPHTCH